jgi:hypothetical protein
MQVFIIDSPQKVVVDQGCWICYSPSEYFVAEQTIQAHIEMYKESGVDTSPLEYVLEALQTREHPQ